MLLFSTLHFAHLQTEFNVKESFLVISRIQLIRESGHHTSRNKLLLGMKGKCEKEGMFFPLWVEQVWSHYFFNKILNLSK